MMRTKHTSLSVQGTYRQRGTVLVVSLLFLLVMTLIGITALSTTTLQEKMAGNLRDQSLAFEAAEAGLRDAELLILNWKDADRPDTAGTCADKTQCITESGTFTDLASQDDTFWNTNAAPFPFMSETDNLPGTFSGQPKVLFEEHAYRPDNNVRGFSATTGRHFYRTTSRGVGGRDTTISILQSVVAKRYR